MLEPSKKDLDKEKQAELDQLAKVNAKCVAGYQAIRTYLYKRLEDMELEAMNKYVVAEYGKVYANLKDLILDSLNEAKVKNVELVEKLLDLNQRVCWRSLGQRRYWRSCRGPRAECRLRPEYVPHGDQAQCLSAATGSGRLRPNPCGWAAAPAPDRCGSNRPPSPEFWR